MNTVTNLKTYPRDVFPIYIAELTITTHGSGSEVKSKTSQTFTSFEPIPPRDVWHGQIHENMIGGDSPRYHVRGIGAELVRHGETLFLKTANKRLINASNALEKALIRCPDLRFWTPRPDPLEGVAVSRIATAEVAPPSRYELRKDQAARQLGFEFGGGS